MTPDSDQVIEQRPRDGGESSPYVYYAGLIAAFNALFGIFLWLYRRSQHPLEKVTPMDVSLLGLATLRMAKLVSEDEITKVIRGPFTAEVDGKRQPKGRGFRWAIGKLVLCPTCSGTWIAALMTYALHLWPRYTRPFLALMTASGMEQLSDAVLSLVYEDRNYVREEENLLREEDSDS
jgi:Protein of unknown function (DUF1360)